MRSRVEDFPRGPADATPFIDQVSGPTRYAAPAFFFSKPVNVGWRPAVARHSALPRSEKSAKAGDEPGVGPTTT